MPRTRYQSRVHSTHHCLELEEKQIKLLDLIQSLGEYLNNDDAAIRAKSKQAVEHPLRAPD